MFATVGGRAVFDIEPGEEVRVISGGSTGATFFDFRGERYYAVRVREQSGWVLATEYSPEEPTEAEIEAILTATGEVTTEAVRTPSPTRQVVEGDDDNDEDSDEVPTQAPPINAAVVTVGGQYRVANATFAFSAPNSGVGVAQINAGDVVTVIGGPELAAGVNWWRLRTPSGSDGWVEEATLTGLPGRPAASTSAPQIATEPPQVIQPTNPPAAPLIGLGSAITIQQSEVFVFSQPGSNISVDLVVAGMVVTIFEGPREVNGIPWWRVRTPGGSDGWISEQALR